MPKAYVYLAMAGAIAAALVAASATTVSLPPCLAEDVVQGLTWEPASSPQSRVWIVRGFVVIAALWGSARLIGTDGSVAARALGACFYGCQSVSGSRVVDLVEASDRGGAMSGIVSGFAAASLAIFAGEAGAISLPSAIAGILGLPFPPRSRWVSTFFPETSRHDLNRSRYPRARRRNHLRPRNAPAPDQESNAVMTRE